MTKKDAPQPVIDRPGSTTVGLSCVCDVCSEAFTSKTKLFKHLEKHGFEGVNTKPIKVILLVGWLSELLVENDIFLADKSNNQCYTDPITEKVEQTLWKAIYAVENKLSSIDEIKTEIERPKGFSRGTSCMQRSSLLLGTEPSCHGCCDTFCFQVKRYLGSGGDDEWVSLVNNLLPSSIRIIFRQTLSTAGAAEYHAENNCSQRRYELMLPLRLIMPDELVTKPDEPIVRRKRNIVLKAMDREFPLDTDEGQARVKFFRNLKRVLKLFAEGRMSYHNFASGGACPEESTAMRKIDRIYHKQIVKVNEEPWVVFSCSADGMLRGQMRRMLGLTIGVIRGWLPESYLHAVLSKGVVADVPAIPGWGMYIAECRYAFWEAKFVTERGDPRRIEGASVDKLNEWTDVVHNHIAKLSEQAGDDWLAQLQEDCWRMYSKYEALQQLQLRSEAALNEQFVDKFGVSFVGSRWSTAQALDGDASSNNGSVDSVKSDGSKPVVAVAKKSRKASSPIQDIIAINENNESNNEECADEEDVVSVATHDSAAEYSKTDNYHNVNNAPALSTHCMELFKKVLNLLHEVESSGMWPLSSTGRQKVITDNTLVENGGYGGSFSVGCLPKHLPQPRGNKQFPELMKACFELEVALCPDRAPSSTIAINRHAQFLPHRDSGAGSGQSGSLIVALGDFIGGEIVIEGVAHDIRYKGVEFDGWSERHWTLPFVGERYSLVWFTPLGIEPEDLYWWKDGQIV